MTTCDGSELPPGRVVLCGGSLRPGDIRAVAQEGRAASGMPPTGSRGVGVNGRVDVGPVPTRAEGSDR